jgi:hypothetical protein
MKYYLSVDNNTLLHSDVDSGCADPTCMLISIDSPAHLLVLLHVHSVTVPHKLFSIW